MRQFVAYRTLLNEGKIPLEYDPLVTFLRREFKRRDVLPEDARAHEPKQKEDITPLIEQLKAETETTVGQVIGEVKSYYRMSASTTSASSVEAEERIKTLHHRLLGTYQQVMELSVAYLVDTRELKLQWQDGETALALEGSREQFPEEQVSWRCAILIEFRHSMVKTLYRIRIASKRSLPLRVVSHILSWLREVMAR